MKSKKIMMTAGIIILSVAASSLGFLPARGATGFKLAKDTVGKYHRLVKYNNNINSRISSLSSFMKRNEDKSRKVMFTLIPPSVKAGKTRFPKGVKDYSNHLSDKMLKSLNDKGLDTYDMRNAFSNYKANTLYYKRDHHWNQKASLRGANFVAGALNRKYKVSVPKKAKFSSLKNYTNITYKNVYKGSFSTLYGKAKTLKEDFSVFAPKWKTAFTLKGYDIKGKFKKAISGKGFMDTFINKNQFNSKSAKYTCFLKGYTAQSVITNKNADSKKRVLVLSTSLGRTSVPYIANYFSEVHFIDTLKSKVNINKYADKIKPDIIVIMYSASSFGKYKCFQFNK